MTEPTDEPRLSRFMKLEDVADELAVTQAQVYALVRNGSLAAIKIGGRGQWRVERDKLEAFIRNAYDDTARFVAEHPFGADNEDDPDAKLDDRASSDEPQDPNAPTA